MRILRVIRSVNPEYGGPIEGIKRLSAAHLGMGHQVTVASLDSSDDPWVKDFPIRVQALGPASTRYGYSGDLLPWLRSNARSYDAAIVSGIWQYHSLAARQAFRTTSLPYFVFPHGMLDPWFKQTYPFKHLKKWLYWPWADYRVLRDAHAVFFTCEEERRLARRSFWLYRCREKVLSYAAADPASLPDHSLSDFFNKHPELRGKRLILFLGRIHPKKGCDLVIKAFAGLFSSPSIPSSRLRDLHLVMAGPDQMGWQGGLETLARELRITPRITWTGMLSGSFKASALTAAEALLLPSHQENFGIAVAEALSYGVPVLISDKVNIWREVIADRAGLVETDTLEGAKNLLHTWICASAEERAAMRRNAQLCYENRFTVDRAARDLLAAVQHYLPIDRNETS